MPDRSWAKYWRLDPRRTIDSYAFPRITQERKRPTAEQVRKRDDETLVEWMGRVARLAGR